MDSPLVSIIVATKNEEKNIASCLQSIKNQIYIPIEIIIIDNNSTDKTRETARKYTNKVYNLTDFIKLDNIKNYRGAQLNFGVKKAKGEIIFFPDADMTFDKNLIAEAVKQLDNYDTLYTPEIIVGTGILGKIRNFERSFYNRTCIDAVRFVKKELFLSVGSFDEKNILFGPDDWDFTKRIKQKTNKITITESKIYHHEKFSSVQNYLEKKKKYTSTFKGYIKKWGRNDEDIRKQMGFIYRLFGVFVENGKWKKMINHPILTIGVYSLRGLVGFNFLLNKLKR